jgi:hypothetical protein
MKEMNDLEMQLRSWAPRRPSAKVKERIFSGAKSAEFAPVHPIILLADYASRIAQSLKPTSFRWLAPAMAGLFLTCILLNQRSAPMASPVTAPMIAMILSSNQSAAAYLPGSFQREQNRLPSDTFEWTNGSGSTSSISSLSESKGRN